jgi:sugar lactone lactonase YvrE
MDPILQLPPDLSIHDPAPFSPTPASAVASWPVGTFVENLAVLDSGDIVVSILSEARIDRVTPAGVVSALIQFEVPPTGLAVSQGALFAAVGEPGQAPMTLWRIDPGAGAGEPWMVVEDAEFLNGLTPFDEGRLLAADSHQGRLYLIDLAARTSVIWLEDERLTRAPRIDFLPGANGVKRVGDRVFVSSTGRALFLAADVQADGSAGALALVAERVRIDDFAFDADGAAYLTTHIGHSLDRLDASGVRVTLAGPDQGLAGSTACAFGRGERDRASLYVTTTGGIVTPPGGVLQPAKLVRLDVGAEGWPLTAGAAA